MKDDMLRRAALAVREDADESPARPDETRARVMRTLKARRERRLTAVRVIMPLAAVLVGSVAWASATHRMPAAWYELTGELGLGADDAPANPSAAPRSGRPMVARSIAVPVPAPPAPEPSSELPSEPPPPPTVEAPVITAPVPTQPRHSAISPAPPPLTTIAHGEASPPPSPAASAATAAPAAPAGPDEHALYRAAHDAHFGARSPGAALAAWDAYLAAAPRGRFAVEAHYNRAICLVRLGRVVEGRRALEPFARGAFGGYRQAEAQRLLDATGDGKR